MFSKWVWDRVFFSSPWFTFFAVVAVMCSQVFQVVAFLLPLKVILLLGSSVVPEYFPPLFLNVGRDELILGLGVCSVIIFIGYVVFDLVGEKLTEIISGRLVVEGRSTCFEKFKSKYFLASTKDLVMVLSGCFFSILVLFSLGVLYFSVFIFMVGYLSVLVGGLVILSGGFSYLESYVLDIPDRMVDFFGASGFFLVFLVLVVDFLYFGQSSILLSIVALLLCRQMFSRLVLAIKSWRRFSVRGSESYSVSQQETGGYRLSTDSMSVVSGVDVHFERSNVEAFLRGCLRSIDVSFSDIDLRLMLASSGELTFCVRCFSGEQSSYFLCRVLAGKSIGAAKRSNNLFECYRRSNLLSLIFQSENDGVYAQLYEWSGNAEPVVDKVNIHLARLASFRDACLIPIPEVLKSMVTKPSLAERLQPSFWSRCRVRTAWLEDGSSEIVDELASSEALINKMNSLPLCVHNPNHFPSNVWKVFGEYKFLSWDLWCLEPLGAAWPYEFGYEELRKVFLTICAERPELDGCLPRDVWLVSVLYHFEGLCVKGKYLEAFKLLPEIKFIISEVPN